MMATRSGLASGNGGLETSGRRESEDEIENENENEDEKKRKKKRENETDGEIKKTARMDGKSEEEEGEPQRVVLANVAGR